MMVRPVSLVVAWAMLAPKLAAGEPQVATPEATSSPGASSLEFWRLPANDGIHCLYLQLRTMGYTSSYDQFRQVIPANPGPQQIRDLAGLAQQLSFGLVPVRLTLEELKSLHTPVTGYFEREGPSTGYFALIVRDMGSDVLVVDGGSVMPAPVPQDTFRRTWSGYALVPAQPDRRGTTLRTMLTVGLASWAGWSLLHHLRQRRVGFA